MGLFYSTTYIKWYKNRETKLLMIGLDMSGKTTILNSLKLQKYIKTVGYIGCNVEVVENNGFNLYCWDVGGEEMTYSWNNQYYQNTQVLIFVVDCNNVYRIDEARNILHDLLEREELEDTVLLIMANKLNLENSISTEQLENRLKLKFIRNHKYHIQRINALNGDGIYEGFDWLGEQINQTIK